MTADPLGMPEPVSLQDLVYEVLERRSSGARGALDEACRTHPEHAARLRECVMQLESRGMLEDDGEAPEVPESLGEFRLLRRIGQGGMGVVFLAEQTALGRQVALKVLRPEQVWFGNAKERFRREIAAIARLSHPGIVPLFASGDSAGLPYFAMALVEGVSVAEVLRALAGRAPEQLDGRALFDVVRAGTAEHGFDPGPSEPGDPLFQGSWPDACAWLVREVAQALEHAHQRGVLHRDVKPSNVLVTPEGRVLLVDFGLAADRSIQGITQSGAQLGSIPYMAPEQITGQIERIDVRTDVYGLGVLYYELLTLRLPFGASDSSSLGRRITAGQKRPLRSANRALGPDTEVVVATAMDVDPARRYASPAHFARDLSNLLARRPIEARAPGPWTLLRRFAQRRPAVAAAAAVTLAACLVGPVTFGLQEARARDRIAAERDVARANFGAALEAIEVLVERVGHRDLRDVPHVDVLRRELLEKARVLYARLESSAPDDLATRLRIASTLGKLARVRQDTGDRAGALAEFDVAEAHLRALVEEHPDEPAVLFEFGNLLCFAAVSRFVGDPDAAVASLAPGLLVLRRAAALDPLARRPRSELARGLLAEAHFLAEQGSEEEAAARYTEALTLTSRLRAEDPSDVDAIELEATAVGKTANLDYFDGRLEASRAGFERVLALVELADPPSSYMRNLRSGAVQMLVRLYQADEEKEEGRVERDGRIDELLLLAHRDIEDLARSFPRNPHFKSMASQSGIAMTRRALRFGELERADATIRESIRRGHDLVDMLPEDPKYWRHLGIAEQRAIEVSLARADLAAARAHAVAALECHASAWTRSGADEDRVNLLDAARAGFQIAIESEDATGAVSLAERLATALPDYGPAVADSALGLFHGAELYARAGDEARASEARTASLRLLVRAAGLDPKLRPYIAGKAEEWGLSGEPALRAALDGE